MLWAVETPLSAELAGLSLDFKPVDCQEGACSQHKGCDTSDRRSSFPPGIIVKRRIYSWWKRRTYEYAVTHVDLRL